MFFQGFFLLFTFFSIMILVNYTKMTNILYFFGKIAGLRPSAYGLLFSEELLETLRLFNSTIYLELEEMYGTVQKSNLLSKLL